MDQEGVRQALVEVLLETTPVVDIRITNCKFSIRLGTYGGKKPSRIVQCFLKGCCRRKSPLKVTVVRDDAGETFCTATVGPYCGRPMLHLHINRAGHINVTGCKQHPRRALRLLAPMLNTSFQHLLRRYKVDNVSTSGKIGGYRTDARLDLRLLKGIVRKDTDSVKSATYNPQRFPSLIIKTRCRGTISVFSNLKFTVVGTKSISDVDRIKVWLRDIVKSYVHSLCSMPPTTCMEKVGALMAFHVPPHPFPAGEAEDGDEAQHVMDYLNGDISELRI